MEALCRAFPIVGLRGSMRDGLGHEHVVEDRIDIKAWWNSKQNIRQRWEAERERETVKWLEQIAKSTKEIASSSKQRSALRSRRRLGRGARLRNWYALRRRRSGRDT
jgi:hypothetical protein